MCQWGARMIGSGRRRRKGAAGIEYALVLSLIAVTLLGAIALMGGQVSGLLDTASNTIDPVHDGGGPGPIGDGSDDGGGESGGGDGSGDPPAALAIQVSPPVLEFPYSADCQAVTVSAPAGGAQALTVDSTALDTQVFATCQPADTTACGSSLAGGDSCVFGVRLATTAAGSYDSQIVVRGLPDGGTETAVPVAIHAAVTAPPTGPAQLALSRQQLLLTPDNGCQIQTVTNTGSAPVSSIRVGSAGGDEMLEYAERCEPAMGRCDTGTLAAGDRCSVGYRWKLNSGYSGYDVPAVIGAGSTQLSYRVVGQESPDAFHLGPSTLVFGAPGQCRTVNVTNDFADPATIGFGALDPALWQYCADSCSGNLLDPGSSCSFGIQPMPGIAGDVYDAVAVSIDTGNDWTQETLQLHYSPGAGGPAVLQWQDMDGTPLSLNGDGFAVYRPHASGAVRLTNIGGEPAYQIGMGDDNGNFQFWTGQDAPPPPQQDGLYPDSGCETVQPGQSCIVDFRFIQTTGHSSATVALSFTDGNDNVTTDAPWLAVFWW